MCLERQRGERDEKCVQRERDRKREREGERWKVCAERGKECDLK